MSLRIEIAATLALAASLGCQTSAQDVEDPQIGDQASSPAAGFSVFGYPAQMAGDFTDAESAIGIDDDELVVGVLVEGQTRAYPLRLLSYGEHLNDRIGKEPVCATW